MAFLFFFSFFSFFWLTKAIFLTGAVRSNAVYDCEQKHPNPLSGA
jgi:hypothetical protein